jgi:hypothetical protein
MPDIFFNYLRRERERLDRQLEDALSAEQPNQGKIALLRQLRSIVDDQLARWSRDLSNDMLTV